MNEPTGSSGPHSYPSVDYRSNGIYAVTGAGRGSPIGTLVHTTDGVNSLSWLTGGSAKAGRPASCDTLIARDGSRTYICPPGRYPYHAGTAEIYLDRRYSGNEVSKLLFAPELEARANETVTYAQIDSLAEAIVKEAAKWGWRFPFIIFGHGGEATPPGRRSDPRHFDWGSLMGRLYVRTLAAGIEGL